MKKISTTLASITLSLLTIGAMAQTPWSWNDTKGLKPIPFPSHLKPVLPNNGDHKVQGGPMNYVLDNSKGDQTIYSSAQFAGGFSNLFILDINSALTIADSGTKQNLSVNNVTTCFDNFWDATSSGYITNIVSGSIKVDSILLYVRYHNTSGLADTIFLFINSVTAAGYPGGSNYFIDTVAIPAVGFFAYNNIDSVQGIMVKKSGILAGATRFSVEMTVHAPKAKDTIGLVWNMQITNACAGLGGYYVPEPTAIGVPNGAVNAVNTFANGYWYYNSKGNHGNNTSLSWPITTPGATQGFYQNSGGYYNAPLPAVLLGCCGGCTGDTIQWFVQDVYIIPYITATSTMGVDNIDASAFSIGQNYPNPFNSETQISYNLATSTSVNVTFSVCDMTGREIVNNNYHSVAPGHHTINLSANTFSPGIYFYTFNIGGNKVTKKMVITE